MKPKQFVALLVAAVSLGYLDTSFAGPTGAAGGASGGAAAGGGTGGTGGVGGTGAAAVKGNNAAAAGTAPSSGILPGDNPNNPSKRPTIPALENGQKTTTDNSGNATVNANGTGTTTSQAQAGTTTVPGAVAGTTANPQTGVATGTVAAPLLPGVTPVAVGTAPGVVAGAGGPTINGKVFGANGNTYYTTTDGMLFYQGTDGTMHNFGRILSSPTPAVGGSTSATATTGSGSGSSLTAGSGTNTQSAFLPQRSGGTNGFLPSAASSNYLAVPRTNSLTPGATGTTLPAGQTTANSFIDANGRTVNVSGTVMSTDGKTFLLGSDGFLYYRGADGAQHIVGSGAK